MRLAEGSTLAEAQWVHLKVLKRKWLEPRWTGPLEVVARTFHVVRLKGKGETWYHWSQCAVADEPRRSVEEIEEDLTEQVQCPDSDESENT